MPAHGGGSMVVLVLRGHAVEGRSRLTSLLARFPMRSGRDPRAILYARAFEATGRLAALQGDLETGRSLQEHALSILEPTQDRARLLTVLEGLAFLSLAFRATTTVPVPTSIGA